jgi:hypothetical protein
MPRSHIQSRNQDRSRNLAEVPVLQLRPVDGLGENEPDAHRRNAKHAAAEQS